MRLTVFAHVQPNLVDDGVLPSRTALSQTIAASIYRAPS